MNPELPSSPYLSDDINRKIQMSLIEGGANIAQLPVGRGLKVTTKSCDYIIRRLADGYTIQGHPVYCPTALPCNIHGSTWGGSMIRSGFIGRGMFLEVGIIGNPRHEGGRPFAITTSQIHDVEEIA